jgi:hypothetical protein
MAMFQTSSFQRSVFAARKELPVLKESKVLKARLVFKALKV